jgi:hypothetical protein
MAKKRYFVNFVAEIEVDDELLKKSTVSNEEVVEYLALNLVKGRALSNLDGFADFPESAVVLLDFRGEGTEEDEQ